MLSKFNLKIQNHHVLPLTILFLGIAFSLYLQRQTPEGLFFSGDAGLKFLLTQQFSAGNTHFDLRLPVEPWVTDLWKQGFYPFQPPFVYDIADQHYITFPFTFPVISALFYRFFGFKGLYILPLLSTWSIWGTLYLLCRRLNLNNFVTATALITLIFASPLTIYSGAFWEHTLAIALAFGGIAIVFGRKIETVSYPELVLSGILIGLSVWFREELLCLVVGICLISFILVALSFKQSQTCIRRKVFVLLISLLVTVALFFGMNVLIYGHPLGAHSFQVVKNFTINSRLKGAFENFKKLNNDFLRYFPPTFFLFVYLGLSAFYQKLKPKPATIALLVVALIFYGLLPLILPGAEDISLDSRTGGKQWGPRFLLILVPIISLAVAISAQLIHETKQPALKLVATVGLSALLVIGINLNTYQGVAFLKSSQLVLPLFNQLQNTPEKVIAVSHQYVGQSLATLFNQKFFFLAETRSDLERLSTAMYQKGHQKFLYVCYPYRQCQPAEEMPETSSILSNQTSYQIQFSKSEILGKYPLYEVSVREN